MESRRLIAAFALFVVTAPAALAQADKPTPAVPAADPAAQIAPGVIQLAPQTQEPAPLLPAVDLSGRAKMSKQTKFQIMRVMNAEFAFARVAFPIGEKGVTLKQDGTFDPPMTEVRQLVVQNGPAARPGDRVQITDVLVKDNEIRFEINGGPKKKKKWHERLQISGMGGTTDLGANATGHLAKGSYIALRYNEDVPEMTPAEIKAQLAPILDFTVKSAAQAYLESLPPHAQQAIKERRVLVGMDRQMVTTAKGRPARKIRERENEVDYEEWIYGAPPADVEFIRFVGDEVVQVKIMPIGGEKIVRTEKELDLGQDRSVQALAAEAPAPKPGANRPTLKRPGDPDPVIDTVNKRQQAGPPMIGDPDATTKPPSDDTTTGPPPPGTPL